MKTLLLALVIALPTASAFAASETAQALQIVEAAIAITKQSDLDFGTASQGDVAKTVASGVSEDAENASFLVTGEANKAYTITLPSNGDVNMITDGGGVPEKTIAVTDFESNPAIGATGMLDASGQQELFVGATRDVILSNQQSGSYADTFTVTVLY
jgi:spore coat protein U-like protein